jgi:hypothetical protein
MTHIFYFLLKCNLLKRFFYYFKHKKPNLKIKLQSFWKISFINKHCQAIFQND